MSNLVLVTGASGFLASHIIYQLIEQGYRVRGTARGKKVLPLKELYKAYPSVDIVEVADLVTGNFADALQGVDAVVHTATAMPGRNSDPETTLTVAIEGSLNVLRQAEKAGIKKIIVTSSVRAVMGDPTVEGDKYRAEHWSPFTKGDARNSPSYAYQASKKYAELAIWEWADAHPHVDVTTILPPYLFGPFAPLTLPIEAGDWIPFSTNIYISNLISPTGKYPLAPIYSDVRDAALAHVKAIKAPGNAQRKRILITSPHTLLFPDLVAYLKKTRPELSDRLIQAPVPVYEINNMYIDYERVEEVLGIEKGEFHSLEQTFLDSIDSVLGVEKLWKTQGYEFTGIAETDL